MRALSDINRSTKKKKRGYIGKKGIGFKSVFKVGRRGQLRRAYAVGLPVLCWSQHPHGDRPQQLDQALAALACAPLFSASSACGRSRSSAG